MESDQTKPVAKKQENFTFLKALDKAPNEPGRRGWWEGPEGDLRLATLRKMYTYGSSDAEACFFSGIDKQQLYYYCKNINPAFAIEKEELKLHPVFIARQTYVHSLRDPNYALRYLAKKIPHEFGENNIVNNNIVVGDMNIFDASYEQVNEGDNLEQLLIDEPTAETSS